jgi:hypothetical protein
MQRVCFDKIQLSGFQSQRVESIALGIYGQRLFAGTQDGGLVLYECKSDGKSCSLVDTIRKQPKEKKPITSLVTVDIWRVLIGIIDGIIAVYDINTLQVLCQLPETKGCTMFSVSERNSLLAVLNKKKLTLYLWQGTNFIIKKELNLPDAAKVILCSHNAVITGYKKHYEAIDLSSLTIHRILDFDKDHRMVCMEMPTSSTRNGYILLSTGLQGIVLDLKGKMNNTITNSSYEERMEWASAPISTHIVSPFILSLLQDSVEIHDMISLASLQRIMISAPPNTSMSLCPCSFGSGLENAYLSIGDQITFLKMVPISTQVQALVEAGLFEEAINLCSLSPNVGQLADIDIHRIHEKFAVSLFQKGDFEGAITHYIAAETNVTNVIIQFPDLIPTQLHTALGISSKSKGSKLSGMILHRAAAAMVQFCEHHRDSILSIADRAEKIKTAGIGAILNSEDLVVDPEEARKAHELLDTVLLTSLIDCSPPRRAAVVDLLSGPNRCHIESCSVLLASQGHSFIEALLWLYRSHNEHKRVLAALTEDRCVATGAWTKQQFYGWTADYLRWLWYHDDPTYPTLALPTLKIVLEYDAELGLSVLTTRSAKNSSFGGKGVTVQEVVSFLESVHPKTSRTGITSSISKNLREKGNKSGIVVTIPLINGRALGIAYLEWLVGSGAAPPSMHDEYAQLLMEGVPFEREIDHSANDLDINDEDNESTLLYKTYRRKLQFFLQTSTDYHPERILKFLPPQFLHEYALLLSRLDKHEEVLKIYIHQLNDINLAQSYCDRIYSNANNDDKSITINHGKNLKNNSKEDLKVYLHLIKVFLEPIENSKMTLNNPLDKVIEIAEKYHDRLDSYVFIGMLPKNTPIAKLTKYLSMTIEYTNARKRNLQIIHQLLRVHEVNLRLKS